MVRIAPEYTRQYLETGRIKPFCDFRLEELFNSTLTGYNSWVPDHTDTVHEVFKTDMGKWLAESTLNTLTGLDSFPRIDVCAGCTQYIDDLYMKGPIQVLRGDYKYHERLGLAYVKDVGSLIPDIPLIVAMPFPSIGAPHQDMEEILHECEIKNIAVHIDGAWISCCRDITFNFDHVAIRSVGISLSKGLGLGWNRIGLRWTKDMKADSISIMNDFHMCNRMVTIVADYILKNIEPDYFWKNYEQLNAKVCEDFNLTPTKAIHAAIDEHGNLVGLTPLLRYLMEEAK